MTVYKIRRKSDGLFSTGGIAPAFSPKGKTWTNRGALTNHLVLIRGQIERARRYIELYPQSYSRINSSLSTLYNDCEVVEFELVEIERATEPVDLENPGKKK
jgi:hypothetical protein